MRAACRRASVVAVPLTTTSSSSSSRPTRHCSTQTCGPHAAADREPDLRARPTTSAGARAPRDAPHDEAPREGVQACQEAEQVQEDLLVVVQEDAQEAVVFERHCFLECVALHLQPPSPVNGTHTQHSSRAPTPSAFVGSTPRKEPRATKSSSSASSRRSSSASTTAQDDKKRRPKRKRSDDENDDDYAPDSKRKNANGGRYYSDDDDYDDDDYLDVDDDDRRSDRRAASSKRQVAEPEPEVAYYAGLLSYLSTLRSIARTDANCTVLCVSRYSKRRLSLLPISTAYK